MDFKFKIIFVLFLVLNTAVFSQKITKLNLNDVLKIAIENNVLIKQAKNNLETYDYQIKNAFGNFLPTLSASTGWRWNREDFKNQFDQSMTFESRAYNVSANSSITLFDGLASIATYEKSKNDYNAYSKYLERLKQDIVFQTEYKFFNVLKAKKLLEVAEQNLLWNKKSLETITEKNKLGQTTLADVYQQQVDYGSAELQLIQAKNNYENLRNDLISFLMLDINLDYEFLEDKKFEFDLAEYEKFEKDFSDFSKIIELTLNNRNDYISQKLFLDSKLDDITIARGNHFPRLTGNLSFYTGANNPSDLFKSRQYSAGLTLSIPIFDGWSTSTRVQLSETNFENARIQLADKEKQIKVELKKAFLDLETAKKKLEVNNKNLIAAAENRKLNEERYNLGSGTLLNLLIANSSYVNAQTQQVNSMYDYIIQKEQVLYYLGLLDYKKYEK